MSAPQVLLAASPLIEGFAWRALVVVAGYALTLGLSGILVRHFTSRPKDPAAPEPEPPPRLLGGPYDPGAVIGKCENLLALTLILADQATGLALIVGAKALVRKDSIDRDPNYYLGGMLVNLVWSVMMGALLRLLLDA